MADELAAPAEENVMRIGKRCFVSNLSWWTSWQDLKDKFRECGNVVYANVMKDEEGKSKGWGIVEYETPEEAVAAVNALNGASLGGRNIIVREDREDRDVKQFNREMGIKPPATRERAPRRSGGPRRRGPPPQGTEEEAQESKPRGGPAGGQPRGTSSGLQIVVQGIPYSYTWQDLKDLFAEIGDVERSDVRRGFGTVKFSNTEAAQQAIDKFHQSELEGRTLAVFMDRWA